MFKKKYLGLAIAGSLLATSAFAELETSIVLKNETATMVKEGIRTGEATSVSDTQGDGKGIYKFENTAQIFLNDTFDNGSSWHGELKLTRDNKAINGYEGHMNMSQQDYLRELYIDTKLGDWDVRAGKQQVVWGTADGIKLLDMMNPTDWREFNQNTMAESRIPTWMINAEKYLDNGDNIQVVVGKAEKNIIPGLNATGDQGHPFVMKGVDSITGKVNGFLNVTPKLGNVATTFDMNAMGGGFRTSDTTGSTTLATFSGMTVDGFAGNSNVTNTSTGGYYVPVEVSAAAATGVSGLGVMLSYGQQFAITSGALESLGFTATPTQYQSSALNTVTGITTYYYNYGGTVESGQTAVSSGSATVTTGYALLVGNTENGNGQPGSIGNAGSTNLVGTGDGWGINTPDSAFEYMPMTTFATFNTFAGMTTAYEVDDKDTRGDLGFRYRGNTSNGLNYSFNYANRVDSNPYINLFYRDKSSKERLSTVYVQGGSPSSGLPVSSTSGTSYVGTVLGTVVTTPTVTISTTSPSLGGYAGGMAWNSTSVLVKDSAGHYYGMTDWSGTSAANASAYTDIELVFQEKQNRVNNIGASFDYAFDTNSSPLILRGEFLYSKGVMTPVVDRLVLATGDLAGSFTMQESDMFNYVIGLDTTVFTDMMLSGQFIQFRNLDYVDQDRTCTTQMAQSVNCSRYTADMPNMSMGNQLQKAEENKEFYSLFVSKPFGESGEGRFNNIFIYEEGGGKWNRFDVEYGISDQLIGTFEYNKYFGNNNTMFGQFENASNIQVGLKYLLQ